MGWIGMGEEAKFGPGYQLKGLLYGGPGNLSDGSSLVTGHWGPKFATGDNIGMKVEVVDGATIVSFRHNEKPLGAAFSIEGWTGDKLRPVVSLGSKGQCQSNLRLELALPKRPGQERGWRETGREKT